MSLITGRKAQNATFALCDCYHEVLGFFRYISYRDNKDCNRLSCYQLNHEMEDVEKEDCYPDFGFYCREQAVEFVQALFRAADYVGESKLIASFEDLDARPNNQVASILTITADGKTVDITKYPGTQTEKSSWEVVLDVRGANQFAVNILELLNRSIK
ncbi:MAG: hypothetical protein NC218_02275 [Acetobacter sp.]|nr:hypothetical protein [Acetobacter sp.]